MEQACTEAVIARRAAGSALRAGVRAGDSFRTQDYMQTMRRERRIGTAGAAVPAAAMAFSGAATRAV